MGNGDSTCLSIVYTMPKISLQKIKLLNFYFPTNVTSYSTFHTPKNVSNVGRKNVVLKLKKKKSYHYQCISNNFSVLMKKFLLLFCRKIPNPHVFLVDSVYIQHTVYSIKLLNKFRFQKLLIRGAFDIFKYFEYLHCLQTEIIKNILSPQC